MRTLPKFLPALLSVFCLLALSIVEGLPIALIFAPPVQAYTSNQTLQDFQKTLAGGEYNKESFDFQSLTGVMASMTSLLIGCTIDDNNDGQIDYNACPPALQTSAITVMGEAIAGIATNPPASGVAYLADVGQKLNLVKPAYAQTGLGFNALLNPFLPAWRAVRNFTYLVFAVAAVIMGVAIMLRYKINPQTVITIQSSIPRLVIGLVFITFSYAIVGLLVDFIYVVFGLLVFGLSAFGFSDFSPQAEFNTYTNAGFGNIAGFITVDGLGAIKDLILSPVQGILP